MIKAQKKLDAGRPSVVVGGKRLLKIRANLEAAGLTQVQWQDRWDAARLFLTADGESGKRYGNDTIRVTPAGVVPVNLPKPLTHLAPGGVLTLGAPVRFSHRRQEWLDRVTAHRAVRSDISYNPDTDRWYLDASWSADVPQPTLEAALAGRVLAVDLNDGHFAAAVLDSCGNRVGDVHTVPYTLRGLPASTRDGHLRAAISALIRLAAQHSCPTIAIEDLNFADARTVGRETMGRGRKGKTFRRTVAGLPTAQFRDRLTGMAHHAGDHRRGR